MKPAAFLKDQQRSYEPNCRVRLKAYRSAGLSTFARRPCLHLLRKYHYQDRPLARYLAPNRATACPNHHYPRGSGAGAADLLHHDRIRLVRVCAIGLDARENGRNLRRRRNVSILVPCASHLSHFTYIQPFIPAAWNSCNGLHIR